jgi:two-component system chemotaxis response regulator CheY
MAKRILITDDALFMRVTLKNILTQNGYEVCGEASNGAEAVKLYSELKPDLVTMDITMPEMDGLEALKQIRAQDPGATVVMCTAMGQKNMVVEAIQSGAKDFIVKPFQPERVLEAVNKLLAA